MSQKSKSFKFLAWLLLLGVLTLVAVGTAIYRRRNSELQRFIVEVLKEKFPFVTVELDSAFFVEGQGVRLHALKVREFESDPTPFLEIAECFVECPLSLKSLLYRNITLSRIVLKEPQLRYESHHTIKRILDKFRECSFSVTRFCPVEIINGQILCPPVGSRTDNFIFGGGDILALPPGSITKENEASPYWQIRGTIANPHIRKLEFQGELTCDLTDWTVHGTGENLEIGPELLLRALDPDSLSPSARSFQGKTTFSFSACRSKKLPKEYQFQLEGELFRGSIDFPLFKHPISDIYVHYTISDDQLLCDRITGRSGPVMILAGYSKKLTDKKDKGTLNAQLDELPLDNRFVLSLGNYFSAKALKLFEHFEFSATTRVNLVLDSPNGVWRPHRLEIQGAHLDCCYDKFPYRLQNLTGSLLLDEEERVRFAIEGADEVKEIRIEGIFDKVFQDALGQVVIQANGYSLDEKLFKALPESSREVILGLHPNGLLDARLVITRKKADAGRDIDVDTSFAINVRNGSIRYERFPYRITGITGQVTRENDTWSFSNMQGKAGTADLQATGILAPQDNGASRFSLQIQATGLPLDDQLRTAMSSSPQYELIKKLNVSGKVNANIRIHYDSDQKDMNLEFEANPLPELTSLRPELFPYELKQLQGLVVYREGELVIENLRGCNGQTTYHSSIRCKFFPDGSWIIDVPSFNIDQLLIDRELQSAVPSKIFNLFTMLKLTGYFNLAGAMQFRQRQPHLPLEAAWDIGVVFQQNTAEWKTPVRHLSGRTRLRGHYVEPQNIQIHGELDIDSMFVQNIQTTGMSGPFLYDGQQVLLGRAVPYPTELAIYQNEFLRNRLYADPLFQEMERRRMQLRPSPELIPSGPGLSPSPLPAVTCIMQPQSVEYLPPVNTPTEEKIVRGQGNGYRSRIQLASVPANPGLAVSANPGIAVSTVNSSALNNTTLNADMTLNNALTNNAGSGGAGHPERRPVQATLTGGTLLVGGGITCQEIPAWQISFLLKDALATDLARDLGQAEQALNGRVTIFSNLRGQGQNFSTIEGDGGAILRDARLYELPQILKVFQILSIHEPDKAAFNSSYIDFRVFGRRLRLERVLFEGNALMLLGQGWLTLEEREQQLDLTMNARLGNSKSQIPVLSEVVGGAGDQIAQIRVQGPASDPVIWAERFPGIKKAWWSIFPGTGGQEKTGSAASLKQQ